MFRYLYLLMLSISLAFFARANGENPLPLPNGATAPDFTITDLDGVTHNLYTYLDQGKTVVIDFSATWCGPCWNYHNSHILSDLHDQYGPNGTNEVVVLFIEADPSTPVSHLYGGGNSQGNWVAGTPYPIADDGNGSIRSAYQVNFFPTLYAICPDRKVYLAGQVSLQTWVNWIGSCNLEGATQIQDVSCSNAADGAIDLSPSGGYGNINYNWSNGQSTQDVSGLAAGNYSVTMTDAFQRSVSVENLFVNEPTPIQASAVNVQEVNCHNGASGSISIGNISGGSGPYSVQWSNGGSGYSIGNLSAGNYTASVTDQVGCVEAINFQVTEPEALGASAFIEEENCSNADGAIYLQGYGGVFPYLYDFGEGLTSNPAYEGLEAGTYTVTVIDNNGCEDLNIFEVPEVPAPVSDAGVNLSLNCSTNVLVLDGSNSSSGSNISYQWTTTDGNIVSGDNTLTPTVDASGVYVLNVVDAQSGCSSISSVTVTEDYSAPFAEAGQDGSIDCVNTLFTVQSDADQGEHITYLWTTVDGNIVGDPTLLSIEVDMAGSYVLAVLNSTSGCLTVDSVLVTSNADNPSVEAGTSPDLTCSVTELTLDGTASEQSADFTYAWSTQDGNIVSGADGLNPSIDQEGTYELTITNNVNGCIGTDLVEVLSDTSIPIVNVANPDSLHCNQNQVSIEADASSNSNTLSYEWSTSSGNILAGETSATASVDASGLYVLQVTDLANGCTTLDSVQVTSIGLPQLSELSVDAVLCQGEANGSAEVSVTNGLAPYSLTWSNGGQGLVQENLEAGTYSVLVLDAVQCADTIDVVIEEPLVLDLDVQGTDETSANANNGVAEALVEGGTQPYDYLWSTGQTTPIISNLAPGEYGVTITDANNCETFGIVDINAFGCAFTSDMSAVDVSCFGLANGTATIDFELGLEPYTILWSNGHTEATISDLEPGIYTVEAIDANNCLLTNSVEISEPEALNMMTESLSSIRCNGLDNGQISISVEGGMGDLNVSWSNGEEGLEIVDLEGGLYVASLTDANGCLLEQEFEIEEPTAIESETIVLDPVTCFGLSDGAIGVNAQGGSGDLDILWSTGSSEWAIQSLEEGVYSASVQDDSLCVLELNFEIEAPEELVVENWTGQPADCFGNATASASVEVEGGTPSYTYLWSNGATTSSLENVEAGVYELQVEDENGCTTSLTVELSSPDLLQLSAVAVEEPSCYGETTGSIDVEATGGVPAYQYVWSSGENTQDLSGLSAGTYTLTMYDANQCATSLEFTLEEPQAMEVSYEQFDVLCHGDNDGSLLFSSNSGGTGTFSYAWSNGVSEADNENLSAGDYNLTVTDANACTVEYTYQISEPDALVLVDASIEDATGTMDNGSVSVIIQGGVEPYSYAWTDDEGTIVSMEPSLDGVAAGNYHLEILDANNCYLGIMTFVVDMISGVTQPELDGTWEVYPNPFSEEFVLSIDLEDPSEIVALNIRDLWGRSYYQKEFEKGVVRLRNSIPLENIPAGIYLIELRQGAKKEVRKLIKQ